MNKGKILHLKITIFIFIITTLFLKNASYTNSGYKLIELFEKPIQNLHNDSSLNFYPTTIRQNINYYKLSNSWNPGPEFPSPVLVGVDKNKNLYIVNNSQSIIVYNSTGNFLFNLKFEDGYYGTYLILDNKGSLYLYLSRWDHNSSDEKIMRFDLKTKKDQTLNADETDKLNRLNFEYKTKDDFIKKVKYLRAKNGDFYKIHFEKKIETIFTADSGRFISPKNLVIYRFDSLSLDDDFSFGIPDQFKFDSIDISKISSHKILRLSSYRMDDDGNIYVSGVRSNDFELTEPFESPLENIKVFKIFNPIFFVWKLEKEDQKK